MEPLVTCRTTVYGPVVLHVIDCPMKLSRVQPARSFTERRKIRYAKLIASQFVATGHELPLLNPTRLPNSWHDKAASLATARAAGIPVNGWRISSWLVTPATRQRHDSPHESDWTSQAVRTRRASANNPYLDWRNPSAAYWFRREILYYTVYSAYLQHL